MIRYLLIRLLVRLFPAYRVERRDVKKVKMQESVVFHVSEGEL